MINIVANFLEKYNIKDKKIIVGFSSGPDSCALACTLNELKSKYPKDITAIQIDETMAVVSFKDDNAIVIYKNHEVKVIQGFRKMFAKEKIPLTFQTIETTDKGYGITLISDGTENALDLGETKVLASFNLYKNEDESLDSFFNANGIAKCPDGLEDKLNTLLSAYKNIL